MAPLLKMPRLRFQVIGLPVVVRVFGLKGGKRGRHMRDWVTSASHQRSDSGDESLTEIQIGSFGEIYASLSCFPSKQDCSPDIIICHPVILELHMESQNRPIKTASVVDRGIPSAFFEMLFSGERGIFLSMGRSFSRELLMCGCRKRSHPKKMQACGSGRRRSRTDKRVDVRSEC